MAIKSFSIRVQGKYILQISLTLLIIALCVYFIKHEGPELHQAFQVIRGSSIWFNAVAFLVTIAYVLIHGLLYKASFKSLNVNLPYKSLLLLSLKRNFISVFLPAGGVSSYAFFNKEIEQEGVSKTKIYLSSVVYGIVGFASLVVIALVAVLLMAMSHSLSQNILLYTGLLILLVLAAIWVFWSILSKGVVYRFISRYFPSFQIIITDLQSEGYKSANLFRALFYSLLIEFCGIAHLIIVAAALGYHLSLYQAIVGYSLATVMYALSPFMRGLGAVELTLSITLINFGIPNVAAISISLLYRVFEFWIPLIISAGSFIYKKDNLLLRIVPAFLTLLLGMTNIFSALLPAIGSRLTFIEDFISPEIIYFSNFTIIVLGISLIVLSAYLLRGLINAWLATMVIVVFSLIGHLVKAIDYEEAIFALCVLLILVYTRKNYIMRSDKRLLHLTKWYLLGALIFIPIYGIVGFYYIHHRHFGQDFGFWQSTVYTFNSLLVFNNDLIPPRTNFAHWFIYSLNFMGGGLFLFSLLSILKPLKHSNIPEISDFEKAKAILKKYGSSPLDYFKIYPDKSFYFGKDGESFVSFKIANGYAVVLEKPVYSNSCSLISIINEFDEYCTINGLRTLYYRIDETDLPTFRKLKKKAIFIGQEAIVDVNTFTLEGGEKKPMRNALNKAKAMGYKCNIYFPPQKEGFLQKLKTVSNEWLLAFDKKEMAFTQGIWNISELKQQIIFAVEDNEEKIHAFANIVPDYAPNEGTYDLIRKTEDSHGTVLDVLMIRMIEYFKENNIQYLNLGMAPFSGIEEVKNFKERTIKFAYENLKQFDHFKGLRFFKEKYAYAWHNKYLVYSNDFDLLQAPMVIEKVSKC